MTGSSRNVFWTSGTSCLNPTSAVANTMAYVGILGVCGALRRGKGVAKRGRMNEKGIESSLMSVREEGKIVHRRQTAEPMFDAPQSPAMILDTKSRPPPKQSPTCTSFFVRLHKSLFPQFGSTPSLTIPFLPFLRLALS